MCGDAEWGSGSEYLRREPICINATDTKYRERCGSGGRRESGDRVLLSRHCGSTNRHRAQDSSAKETAGGGGLRQAPTLGRPTGPG